MALVRMKSEAGVKIPDTELLQCRRRPVGVECTRVSLHSLPSDLYLRQPLLSGPRSFGGRRRSRVLRSNFA